MCLELAPRLSQGDGRSHKAGKPWPAGRPAAQGQLWGQGTPQALSTGQCASRTSLGQGMRAAQCFWLSSPPAPRAAPGLGGTRGLAGGQASPVAWPGQAGPHKAWHIPGPSQSPSLCCAPDCSRNQIHKCVSGQLPDDRKASRAPAVLDARNRDPGAAMPTTLHPRDARGRGEQKPAQRPRDPEQKLVMRPRDARS